MAADGKRTRLASYEEKAEALLSAYRTGTDEAMARHWALTWHRRSWSAMRTYVQIDLGRRAGDEVEIDLDDARWLIAREHGFDDWPALVAACARSQGNSTMLEKPIELLDSALESSPRSHRAVRAWDVALARLAEADVRGIDAHGTMTDAMLTDIARFPHLTTLRLGGSNALTDDGIREIARLRHLRHLDLSGTAITDAGLRALAELRELETLSLAWTRVTDEGLSVLARFDALTDLDLSGTQSGDGAMCALQGKAALAQVKPGNAVTAAGILALHDVPRFATWHGGEPDFSLLSLEARPNRLSLPRGIGPRGIAALAGLDGLFGLAIAGGDRPLDAHAVRPLLDLPRLGWLSVDVGDDAMEVLGELASLRALLCQDTPAGDDGFEALSRSRSIELIWGRRCHNLQRRGFQALASMRSLRALSVSCQSVDDEGVASLPDFPALRELMPMDVPDAGYRHIGRCHRLEALILMYCRDTSDAATEQLTDLSNLRRYFASYTQVTDRTPELLASIDALESVTFDSCAGVTDAGIAHLARLPRLRELRVSGRGITAAVQSAFPSTVHVHYGL